MHLIHVELSQSVVLVSELNILPLLKQNTNYTDYIFSFETFEVNFSFVNWLLTPTSIFTNMTSRLFM